MKKNKITLDEFLELDYRMVIDPYNDEENGEKGFVITCPELTGVEVFGETLDEAFEELHEAKIAWFYMKENLGEEVLPPKQKSRPSGRLTLRLPIFLHEKVISYSEDNNISVNNAINFLITEGLASSNFKSVLYEVKEMKKQITDSPQHISINFRNEGISRYKYNRRDYEIHSQRSSPDTKFHFETTGIN